MKNELFNRIPLNRFGKSKEVEDVVKKFSKVEATMYTKTLVKVGFPRLVMQRGKVLGFLRKTAEGVKQTLSKIGQPPVHRKITSQKIKTAKNDILQQLQ